MVLGWGNNSNSALQYREPDIRNVTTPVELSQLSDHTITDISAAHGDGSSSSHFVGFVHNEMDPTGDNDFLASWSVGRNTHGISGTGYPDGRLDDITATHGFQSEPRLVEIAAGYDFAAGIDVDGRLNSWGNTPATLIEGTSTPEPYVAPVPTSPEGVVLSQLRLGINTIAAVGDDGNAYMWGANPGTELTGDGYVLPTPEVTLTGAFFGGSAAPKLTKVDSNTWTVDTPQHAAGIVDVNVQWAVSGVDQTPLTHTNGFTFTGQPTLTALTSKTGRVGEPVTFDLSMTGFPEPQIVWEVAYPTETPPILRALDDWQPLANDPSAVISDNGRTLTITPGLGHQGAKYRATATNEYGSTTSNEASLTIGSDGDNDNGPDGDNDNGPDGGNNNGPDGDNNNGPDGNNNGPDGNNNGPDGNNNNGPDDGNNNNASLPVTGGAAALWLVSGAAAIALAAGAFVLRRGARQQ